RPDGTLVRRRPCSKIDRRGDSRSATHGIQISGANQIPRCRTAPARLTRVKAVIAHARLRGDRIKGHRLRRLGLRAIKHVTPTDQGEPAPAFKTARFTR